MTTIICTAEETVVMQANYVHRHVTPAGLLTNRDDYVSLCAYYHADVLILDRTPEGEPCEESGWATITDPKLPAGYLHIGYLPILATKDLLLQHVAGDHATRLMVDDDTDNGCLSLTVGRLGVWRELTGVDYHTHPAVSAIVSMKRHVHKRPRWVLRNANGEWWTPPAPINDIRTRDAFEPDRPFVTWDRRAAYLASAAAVDLPYRQLPHTGYDYDPLCGYYRVRIDDSTLGAYFRRLLRFEATGDGTVWVCHPTLRVLQQTGTLIQVVDSYSTEERMRILRPWAEKWRDALTDATGHPHMKDVLKRGYAQALGGLFDVKKGTVYRPDWRHMIIDHNRAHMLRIVERVYRANGVLPAEINTDSITYFCDHPDGTTDAVDALIGVGPNIGNMRTATTGMVKQLTLPPAPQMVPAVLTAQPWTGPVSRAE